VVATAAVAAEEAAQRLPADRPAVRAAARSARCLYPALAFSVL